MKIPFSILVSLSRFAVGVIAATAFGATAGAQAQSTLNAVKNRGEVVCGVSTGLLGFSNPDDQGNWSGLDVDLCRAVAAAIFNDADKVKYVPLGTEDRFKALESKEIDLLSRNSSWTMSRETASGLSFAAVNYYDGQGFLVRKDREIDSALALGNSKICVQANTTTALNLGDYFRGHHMTYEAITFPNVDATVTAYDTGKCDAFSSDISQLHAERLKLSKPDDHMILPDVISKEPLGPAVRQDDIQWLAIVRWSYYAMVNAEELGVSSKNIDEALKSDQPAVRRLVGIEGNYGEQIGLTRDWAARIIRLVGNYGESYRRNLGTGSKLDIPRGLNQLWTKGGIQYAPPIR